jgi:hypothetical protein
LLMNKVIPLGKVWVMSVRVWLLLYIIVRVLFRVTPLREEPRFIG